MKKIILVLGLVLMTSPLYSATVQSERGPVTVNDGDVVYQNSKWSGVIDGLNNVTFHKWNFSREHKEEIFTNSTNITFIDCNLTNVVVPEGLGFRVINSPNRYRREYTVGIIDYLEIIEGNGDKTTYILDKVGGSIQSTFKIEKAKENEKIKVIDARRLSASYPVSLMYK